MQKKELSSHFPRLKKFVSGFLIFTLFFTQTVQINWFEKANAGVSAYRDIVSIIVDKDTYKSLEGEIKNYAQNIQTYLGQTRTAIVIVAPGTPPSVIATKNESLYYEGDTPGAPSQLVGTVLIGNVPVPMVEKDGNYFPSLYPYVDFKEKAFVYDPASKTYKHSNESMLEVPEIWHGVISPAVGREWKGAEDIEKIKKFLAKTENFYKKQAKFTDADTPPRVFYYDGFTESRSVDARSLFQYGLYIKNLENLSYNRYSKYLLKDINMALKAFDGQTSESEGNAYANLIDTVIKENGGKDEKDTEKYRQALEKLKSNGNLSDDSLKNVPDIQTVNHINELVKPFNKIFNKKVLGDELKAVHNAGRYNTGTTVRADMGVFSVSIMDKIAQDTVRATNNMLEKAIEEDLKRKNIIRPIVIFDGYNIQRNKETTTPVLNGIGPDRNIYEYENYYFGELAKNIKSATGCTIARGGYGEKQEFGQPILTEANVAFDVHSVKPQMAQLEKDNDEITNLFGTRQAERRDIMCYRTDRNKMPVKIKSYWGGNSVLRLSDPRLNTDDSGSKKDVFAMPPEDIFKGFTAPIFTLQGMRETQRLPKPSLKSCIGNESFAYSLRKPGLRQVSCTKTTGSGDNKSTKTIVYNTAYPSEWNTMGTPCGGWGYKNTAPEYATSNPHYSCTSTNLESGTEQIASFATEYVNYKNQRYNCVVGSVMLGNEEVAQSTQSCIERRESGGDQGKGKSVEYIDRTTYKNLAYHTIAPGYLKHESPTQEEIKAALKSGVTPNLAIDTTRSIEFQTPKGNIVTLTYPNFFRANVKNKDDVRKFLTEESEKQWKKILEIESKTSLSDAEKQVNNEIFKINNLSENLNDFDWNNYISDEDIMKMLQAKNWMHPDVSQKYKQTIETMLSYSGKYTEKTENTPPSIGDKENQDYEIAYLGLTPFAPDTGKGISSFESAQQNYKIGRQKIRAINITDQEDKNKDKDESSSTECAPPDGVVIFKWPQAVACWMKKQFPMKIQSGKCSGKTIGAQEDEKPEKDITSLPTVEQIKEIKSATLVRHLPREVLTYNDSLSFFTALENDKNRLSLPEGTQAEMKILSLSSDGKPISDEKNFEEYISISPKNQQTQGGKVHFVVTTKQKSATVKLQITYTIPTGDNTSIKKEEEVALVISDQYAKVSLQQNGQPTYAIDVEKSAPELIVEKVSYKNPGKGEKLNNFEVNIFDAITEKKIVDKQKIINGNFTIPDEISKKSGSYRVEVIGPEKQFGSLTFSVMAGKFSKITLQPVSTALIGKEELPVRILLQDNLGNPIEPNLHTLNIKVENGFIPMVSGEKKTNFSPDLMESFFDINVQSDGSGKPIKITATADEISQSQEIQVYKDATIKLIQAEKPVVGGKNILLKVQILDKNNQPIQGFNSLFTASFPKDGGRLEREIIQIKNGVSQPVNYIPGTRAGNLPVTFSVVGYGVFDQNFAVQPGQAMYVDHSIVDNYLQFFLKDRYGNIANENLKAIIKKNNEKTEEKNFENGILTLPRVAGYYTIEVSELKNRSIQLVEEKGICAPLPENATQDQKEKQKDCIAPGLSKYSTYVQNTAQTKFDFLPDYNARYTVLAGGQFLREGEDILYDSDPDKSQSLAVTTLLDSPYTSQTIFNITPSGAVTLGNVSDIAPSVSLGLQDNFPKLSLINEVDGTLMAEVFYALQNAIFYTDCENINTCSKNNTKDFIAVSKGADKNISIKKINNTLVFSYQGEKIVSLGADGSIVSNGVVSLEPINNSNANGLHFLLNYSGINLAEILYHSDESQSIEQRKNHENGTIGLYTKKGKSLPFSQTSFSADAQGYRVVIPSQNKQLDPQKLGPNNIDDIGALSQTPNIGWQGNNTMMLSYAGGDTVGQATYRFHSYMMINMGDPVAHVQNGRRDTQVDGIDRTIGKQIGMTRRANVKELLHRDMNQDNLEDIVVVYEDGYLELLLNFGDRFRSRDMIAYVPPKGLNIVKLGDFSGDGYADIVAVGQSGSLQFWENKNRKFIKKDLIVSNGSAPTGVTQMKVYDMDSDKKDDIVYLSAGGKLAILYGTEKSGVFTEKVLDPALAISLSSEKFTDEGALYSSSHIEQQTGKLGVNPLSNTGANDSLVKSLIYYNYTLPAKKTDNIISQKTKVEISDSKGVEEKIESIFETGKDSETDEENFISKNFDKNKTNNTVSTITKTTTTTVIDNNTKPKTHTFMRGAYLSGVNLSAEKTYKNLGHSTLLPNDTVKVTIEITNNTKTIAKNIEYLDSIPRIFSTDETKKYIASIGGNAGKEKEFERLYTGDYDAFFKVGDLGAGQSATITYTVKALPASFGEMLVDDFEKATAGTDDFGDVGFKTETTCGGNMLLYLSTAQREYIKTRNNRELFEPKLSDETQEKLKDENKNGVPDNLESSTQSQTLTMKTKDGNKDIPIKQLTKEVREQFEKDYQDIGHQPAVEDDSFVRFDKNGSLQEGSLEFSLGFDPEMSKKIESKAQEFMDGLACGFGGGSCMSFPINWAPLAPGSQPVAFGTPLGLLSPSQGYPIFSTLTWQQSACGPSPCCLPSAYPVSVQGVGGGICGAPSAGGYLGTWDTTNAVRIFVTPTLTLGMGMAVCFGGPATSVGEIPPAGLFPLVPSGNCIVVAKPMPFCKGDGSADDGDLSEIIESNNNDDDSGNTWNASSCDMQIRPEADIKKVKTEIRNKAVEYLKNKKSFDFAGFSATLSKGNISSLNSSKPLLKIGSGGPGEEVFDLSIDSNTKIADFGKIVNPKNKRISGFPDFIMDWLSRQMDQVTNALFTPPNLTIIPPKDFGQNAKINNTYKNFLSESDASYKKASTDAMKQRLGSAYDDQVNPQQTTNSRLVGKSNSWLGKQYASLLDGGISSLQGGTSKIKGGLNAIQSAYTFIGKLPFINLKTARVPINIPWVLPSELDQYERAIDRQMEEVEDALENWCTKGDSEKCLKQKAELNSSGFFSSLQANRARIEEYRKFPEKLKKYLNWKQKYLYQLTCNIEAIQKMTIGWVKKNGIRFQKWAELFVLIKAIAETWQPVLDIFADTSAQCGVCRNERYNSQYWKFKIISIIVPKIPVIQFKIWPDIILDLSDVRLGIDVIVPQFEFKIAPIRLPRLPNISLPNSPTLNFSLPTLPLLPKIPTLPDLPDLPSLPTVKLPNLPPPPKLPKIFGAVKVAVNIMKLISKLYCFYQKTALVPEWNVGDVISQRTERQGTIPIDFLDVEYSSFNVPSFKAIKIATHLNYQLKADFLVEMARTAVKPINAFGNDLQKNIPDEILGEQAGKLQEKVDGVGTKINEAADKVEDTVKDNVNKPAEKLKNQIQNEINSAENQAQNASDKVENDAQKGVDEATKSAYLQKIHAIQKTLKSYENTEIDTDEMYTFLSSQLAQAGFEKEKQALEKEMQATKTKANLLAKELIETNNKKFNLIKNTLEKSTEDIAIGQNIVEALRGNQDMQEVLASNQNVYLLASKEQKNPDKYEAVNKKLAQISTNQSAISLEKDIALENTTNRLATRYKNMIAQNTSQVGSATVESVQPISQGYSPKFKGIYILISGKYQTRLFDYIDPVDKNTKVSVLDIDKDGDNDFLFVLDNKIYLKYNHTNTPSKIEDKQFSVSNLDTSSPKPFVPNNFVQGALSPKELNVQFRPANPDTETQWRMEFYDRYLDWYREDEKETVSTKMTIDLFTEDKKATDFDAIGIARTRVTRSLHSGYDNENFKLIAPNITFLTGSIDLSLSAGRAIYTGKENVKVTLQVTGKKDELIPLESYSRYEFKEQVILKADKGPLFIIGDTQGYKVYTGSQDLEGLPLLTGMEVVSDKEITVKNHLQENADIKLPQNGHYITKSLGTKSDGYNFTIPYPDGYYYAKLHNLTGPRKDQAGVILLSPSVGSDDTPPVTSLDAIQRLPVYATKQIKLKEVITELSDYKLTIVDNDFGESGNATIDENTKILTLGKFDAPGEKHLTLQITDENGNETKMKMTIEVYTPIPHITDVNLDAMTLSGTIKEFIDNEPVHIFRLRPTEKPIFIDKKSANTKNDGIFMHTWQKKEEEIILTASGDTMKISSHGVIKNLPAGFTTEILSATSSEPMRIYINDAQKHAVYKQILVLPETAKLVNRLENPDETFGLLISISNSTQFVSAGLADPSIPGGAYVTDEKANPLLAVAKDGNIYLLDDTILLTLGSEGEYIKIIATKNGQEIANFVYKIDFFYTK